MARHAIALTGCLLAAGMLVQPASGRAEEPAGPPAIQLAKSYGPSFPAMEDPPIDENGAPTLIVQQGFGCIITGTAGTVAAMGASSLNVVQHIAGGLVAPANAAVLGLGLVGVVFATYCSIGAAVTPLYLYVTGTPSAEPPPPPAAQVGTRPPPRDPALLHPAMFGSVQPNGVLGSAIVRRRAPASR